MWKSVALTSGGSYLVGMVKPMPDSSEGREDSHLSHLGERVISGVWLQKICHSDRSSHTYPMQNQTSAYHITEPVIASWTIWGTQNHESFVNVYTSADSFAPRISASRQKQEMWAEAQPLPYSVSYAHLCRRQFSAFTAPAGWPICTVTVMLSLPNKVP